MNDKDTDIMINVLATETKWATVAYQIHRNDIFRRLWLVLLLGISGVTAGGMLLLGPTPLPLGGVLFLATLGMIVYQPRWGSISCSFLR